MLHLGNGEFLDTLLLSLKEIEALDGSCVKTNKTPMNFAISESDPSDNSGKQSYRYRCYRRLKIVILCAARLIDRNFHIKVKRSFIDLDKSRNHKRMIKYLNEVLFREQTAMFKVAPPPPPFVPLNSTSF